MQYLSAHNMIVFLHLLLCPLENDSIYFCYKNLCLKYLMKNKGKNYHVTFSIPEDVKPIVKADIKFSILNHIQGNSPCTSI